MGNRQMSIAVGWNRSRSAGFESAMPRCDRGRLEPVGNSAQRSKLTIRVGDESETRASLAHLIRRPLGIDALAAKLLERPVEVIDSECHVAVSGPEFARDW